MAGPNKHVYKKRAMVKFGKMKGRDLFEFQEILYYLNNYIGVNGKLNKQTGTTPPQLSSLIKIHPDFKYTCRAFWYGDVTDICERYYNE